MYRVFLFIAFLAYCSSAPSYSGFNVQKSIPVETSDHNDLVDNTGAGYAYFKKQQVDTRPSVQPPAGMPTQDLVAYMQANAFKTELPTQVKTFANNYGIAQGDQSGFRQNDISQIRSTLPSGYDTQRVILPPQSTLLTRNSLNQFQDRDLLDSYQQGDSRTLGSQQFLLPKTNLNFQQRTLGGYGGQSQDRFLPEQPQSTWSVQQKSAGFSSSYGGQGQQPVSSGFLVQTNQENDNQPMTNAVFMSSQAPTQRFISQPQPTQRGW